MRNLPQFTIQTQSNLIIYLKSGTLVNNYVPFKNLINADNSISDFKTTNLDYNLNTPVNIEIQPSFDGSVNLILNSDNTKPKLINSRFSAGEKNTYDIINHSGNKDTNLYENEQLDLDTRLYKTINKIPNLEFLGILNDGKMNCGSYHFYFKFIDNDGNETDFISESGLVTCHIGNINDPKAIRMGMVNEDSKKSIKFKLSNLDTAYDFIRVYYTRTTSDSSQQDITTAHYIDTKFLIIGDIADILITGFETHINSSLIDINPLYELVNSVKAQAQCQDMLFLANINKAKIEYEELVDLSLHFVPQLVQEGSIGDLNHNYDDISGKESFEYFNAKNLYYKLGIWPEEYYRLGIVYLLNDYTLSPVFNTRGFNFDQTNIIPTVFSAGELNNRNLISIKDDYYLEDGKPFENSKGVIKVGALQVIDIGGVNPIGIKFTVDDPNTLKILETYTKGFFLVRQERIPTIYAQGLVIGKTEKDFGNIPLIKANSQYITESFLKTDCTLGKTFIKSIPNSNINTKAALIPETELRSSIFSELFTSTNYKITKVTNPTSISLTQDGDNYFLPKDNNITNISKPISDSLLTLVQDGLKLTTNGTDYFAAKAGEAEEAWQSLDILHKWTTEFGSTTDAHINDTLKDSTSLVRGLYGSYVGLSNNSFQFGTLINVRPSDFDNTTAYQEIMFRLRMDSSEPYMAISDRISLNNFNNVIAYRGDCYICNFTHRMNRNFIDPELPSNDKIIDPNTWKHNYAVWQDSYSSNSQEASNRILITYKEKDSDNSIKEPSDADYANAGGFIATLTGQQSYKVRGADKINRADVNAVNLGHWVTFKVMANTNLSMRDIDFEHTNEEGIFGHKRSFFPLQPLSNEGSFKLPDSNIINGAANVTLSQRKNFIVPNIPFIKNKFDTRILYSDIHVTDAFKNGYRVFTGGHYQDYTKIYGSIVDLQEWFGSLFCVLEHGVMIIPVNERVVAAEGTGGLAYINTSNVLPENPRVISDIFGSIWQESVIKTKSGMYGVDTVAKKIWHVPVADRYGMQVLTNISDLKVQRFLNENINLTESDKLPLMGVTNVKTHYNKNKGDIIFTFYNKDKEWSLCYNENLQKFITYYSWIPSYSANIDNIFFTFDKQKSNNLINNKYFTYTYYFDNNYINFIPNNTISRYTIGDNPLLRILDNKLVYKPNLVTDKEWGDLTYIDIDIYNNIKIDTQRIFKENQTPKIWKHGQAGNYAGQGTIKPTNWYGNVEPFEFEFVVAEIPIVQKIFENLKLISNKAEPDSFEFEVVGETYDWYEVKDLIVWINTKVKNAKSTDIDYFYFKDLPSAYKYILGLNLLQIEGIYSEFVRPFSKEESQFDIYKFPKLPFLTRVRKTTGLWEANSSNVELRLDDLLNEDRIHTQQNANNIKKFGRVKGNIIYKEDFWDVEIRPITFKYAYITSLNELKFTNGKESRIRDKYMKVRVKYSGNDLAIIQGIKTIFKISYS